MITRLSLIFICFLSAVTSLCAQALLPVIHETDTEWFIDWPPADEYSYGAQLTVIDKATGIIRYYEDYGFEGEPIEEPSWYSSSARLPTEIPMLGLLVGGYMNELIVPQPRQNKLSLYAPTGYFSSAVITAAGVGPDAALSFPAVAEQAQFFDPVLLVQTSLNSPPASVQHSLLFSSGLGDPYDVPEVDQFERFERSLTFPPLSSSAFDGANAVVAIVRAEKIWLAQPQLGDLKINAEQDFPEGGQLLYGNFLRTGQTNQILVYAPGDTRLYVYKLVDTSGVWGLDEPIEFDLEAPIQTATRVLLGGKFFVAVHYHDSKQMDIIDLVEGTVVQQLQIDASADVTAVISMKGDRMLAFSGDKGISSQYELFAEDGSGAFKSLFRADLPLDAFQLSLDAERPNIFFFDQSPLTDQNADLLGWGAGENWASEASIQYSSAVYQAWSDGGAATGLQQTYQSSRLIPDGTQVVVPNQVNGSASCIGLGLRGSSDLALLASWSPRPGAQDQLSKISASFPAGATLYYRTSDAQAWRTYSGAFYPERDSFAIDYYLETASGQKGAIETVAYHFTLGAFNQDTNGDGIPDFVQAASGLDPFGTGDSDGDRASDLDELIAETSALDPLEFPGAGSTQDRGVYQSFEITGQNVHAQNWLPGSVGFVDRLTGARLRGASVPDGRSFATFANLPVVYPEQILAVSTESRFTCHGDDAEQPTGFEILALVGVEPFATFDVDAPYTGGAVADAAAAWLDALEGHIGGQRAVRSLTLDVEATALALAFENALEDEFELRGLLTADEQLTLFPMRLGDQRWLSLSEIIEREDDANGDAPFTLEDLLDGLLLSESYASAQASRSTRAEWPEFCAEVYAMFVSAQVPHTSGRSPVDMLRALLRDKSLPQDLIDTLGFDPNRAAIPLSEAAALRSHDFVREDVRNYSLQVVGADLGGCFEAVDALNRSFTLVNASGERYVSSKSLDILPGTAIGVTAVVRSNIEACQGTVLEVRSLRLEMLPELATQDADGNLLDDNWELFWYGEGDYDPFSTLDGSGYSLLQQYLSGSDPTDPADTPEQPIEDLRAPDIAIRKSNPNEFTLTWEWPGLYSDRIKFKLVEADNLGNLGAVEPVSVEYSRLGDAHTLVLVVPSTDQRFFRLVLSIQ